MRPSARISGVVKIGEDVIVSDAAEFINLDLNSDALCAKLHNRWQTAPNIRKCVLWKHCF